MLTDGYPLLDLYARIPDDPAYRAMQSFSDEFRERNVDALKYYSRRWVADPLHHWSRRWEYLYVTERFGQAVEERPDATLRVLDAGSGLTFFAHWLAHRFPTLSIECCDMDPRAAASAARLRPPAAATVSYATQDLADLSHPDGAFDVIDCVSVLEHSARHAEIVAEFERTLRPGGRLILTIDISPDGRWQIPRERARMLLDELGRRFTPDSDYAAMLEDFDPSRMLTTRYARELDPSLLPWKYPSVRDAWRNLRRPTQLVKPRFKYLTCFCMLWRKKDT